MIEFNIPNFRGPVTQAVTAAALAGSTARKMRQKKLSSTKGEAKGKVKYVTYCPLDLCPLENAAHPEFHPHVTVGPRQKKASIRGMSWAVR